MKLVAVIVLDDDGTWETWDTLGDCKVALVTPEDHRRMCQANDGEGCDNPLDYAVATFKGKEITLKPRSRR